MDLGALAKAARRSEPRVIITLCDDRYVPAVMLAAADVLALVETVRVARGALRLYAVQANGAHARAALGSLAVLVETDGPTDTEGDHNG